MSQGYARELEVAIEAVREAAKLCRAVQSKITADVLAKKDRSPVTVADYGSQALVCSRLRHSFPADPVIAEEDSSELRKPENAPILDRVLEHVCRIRPDADAATIAQWIDHGRTRQYVERFWTLDPIDGTKGFLRGEQYAIALALIVAGRIELGVLGCPNLPMGRGESGPSGVLLFATRGGGAWQQSIESLAVPVRVGVNPQVDLEQSRFCESVESGHSSHGDAAVLAERLGIKRPPLRMDSQAKYAVVARGEAEIYLRLPTQAGYREKIWDHAAGVLVVTEAGGTVTDIAGHELDFTQGPELVNNRGVIVSSGPMHARVLAGLSDLGPAQ